MKVTPKYKSFDMSDYAWDDLFYAVYQLVNSIIRQRVPGRMGPLSALYKLTLTWDQKRFRWDGRTEHSAHFWQQTFREMNQFNELIRRVLVAAWKHETIRYLPFDVCGALRIYWAMSFDILRDFSAEAEKAGVEGCDRVHPYKRNPRIPYMYTPNPYV